MSRKSESATYIHGHHASVLRSHTWPNVANSAAYLLPYLKPTMKILDIGCGPGTITMDLVGYVPEGRVTGLDRAQDIVQARALAKEKGVNNVEFLEGDANALDYADDTFDVVICHQVVQHVRDPIAVLREMRRVTRVGGITAVREADYGTFTWYPPIDGMDGWLALYERVARASGGEPDAGRMIHAWAKKAGFASEDVACSSSTKEGSRLVEPAVG